MYFDPPAPKQDQPFTINVLSKGPSGRYLSIALDITTPLNPADVRVVTYPSYPDIPSFYQAQGYQYSWQWLISQAQAGPTPYLFEFSVNGRSQYCVSNILYVDPPVISAWIKASGDVHSNDWIRASGGPNAITYQGIICPAQSQNPRVTGGLITTYGLSDNFGNSEAICVVGSSTSFAPFKLLTYDDLESIYFTQSKLQSAQKITLTGNQTQSSLTNPINLSSQASAPLLKNWLAGLKNLIPVSAVFAQSAPACSGDSCTDCLISNQGDPTAFLKFYEDNGWDISCGSQTGIIQNWCNVTSEQATAQCNSMKAGVCATACGYVAPTPTPPVLDKLYHITGDLTIESNMTVGKTGVIFIDGNLSINTNLTHTSSNAGLVLAAKGDVTINPSVTRIDAVIISSGKIYTAGSGCNHGSPVTASQLIINGSLISLDSNKNIEFCRTLGSNNTTTPTEQIIQQPKYLVILRNLFSQTYQKWEEIQ
ncbi:MAG: hypothetical protein PHV63_04055 [Candidatus Daviesbacteria bacterium]|nr:hypothetical protein [Candidatus Daviesbacteria bacterium]